MHLFCAHIPEFMKLYGKMSRFSQERFEHGNLEITEGYFKASNHIGTDALKQVLHRQQRIGLLKVTVSPRKKRAYKCTKCSLSGHKINNCDKKHK